MVDPGELRKILVRAASETAALLRDNACDPRMVESIRGETTRADLIAEEYAVDLLKSMGLRARIIGEEGGIYGEGDLVVIIDPLDGSVNYLNCIPWASVSIAVAPKDASSFNEILAGAVAPIFTGYTLSFERGGGCYEGGSRIAGAYKPYKRMLAVYAEHPDALYSIARVIESIGGFKVRSLGSAALELAYTAVGRITLFLDVRSKLRNVDIAAAAGMLAECGGILLGPEGGWPPLRLDRIDRVGSVAASLDAGLARRVYSLVGPQMRRPGS